MSKKLTLTLIVLYAISVLAAVVILIRRPVGTGMMISLKSPRVLSQDAVAVVRIHGPISISYKSTLRLSAHERIIKSIRSLAKRTDVKAVVLRINSPGGSVAAVQEIYNEVINLRKNGKTVVASLGDIAASGAYYIASAADRIVSNPGTLTGSVGVIFELIQAQELMKKIGVRIETIKSGKHKDIGSFSRELTVEEREIFRSLINNAYEQFINAIVEGRNMPKDKVLSFADGRIFTGAQAKNLGIVDELGNESAAIKTATELAGIKGTPRIIYERDPIEEFFSSINLRESSPIEYLLGRKVRFEYILE